MADKEIRLYTTPTCPWCRKAKDYLNEKQAKYTEIDVSQDRDRLQEMVQLTGQRGVPVITIDNDVIVGFNQAQIDSKLGA